jgi:hypothetical protein
MTATVPAQGTRPRPPKPSGRAALAGLVSVAVNFALPVLAYHLIRRHTASSAMALAMAGAIPVAYTLAILAIRRRFSVLGLISVATFALGVLASWASGGNALALDLQEPALTGLFAVACLVSIAIGHPLHQVILRAMGRSNPHYTQVADRADTAKTSLVSTAIIGLAFLSHAVAVAVLALTQTTATFLALQQPVGLPFLGLGVAGLFIYGNGQQARQRAAAATAARDGQLRDGQLGDGQLRDGRPGDGQLRDGRPGAGSA